MFLVSALQTCRRTEVARYLCPSAHFCPSAPTPAHAATSRAVCPGPCPVCAHCLWYLALGTAEKSSVSIFIAFSLQVFVCIVKIPLSLLLWTGPALSASSHMRGAPDSSSSWWPSTGLFPVHPCLLALHVLNIQYSVYTAPLQSWGFKINLPNDPISCARAHLWQHLGSQREAWNCSDLCSQAHTNAWQAASIQIKLELESPKPWIAPEEDRSCSVIGSYVSWQLDSSLERWWCCEGCWKQIAQPAQPGCFTAAVFIRGQQAHEILSNTFLLSGSYDRST